MVSSKSKRSVNNSFRGFDILKDVHQDVLPCASTAINGVLPKLQVKVRLHAYGRWEVHAKLLICSNTKCSAMLYIC